LFFHGNKEEKKDVLVSLHGKAAMIVRFTYPNMSGNERRRKKLSVASMARIGDLIQHAFSHLSTRTPPQIRGGLLKIHRVIVHIRLLVPFEDFFDKGEMAL
jgi:hypothetical protein